MNSRIDQKDQVQQATDLVRLIGEFVALRPRGREFIGLCPFHDDKNPSLNVSPAKQIYKCFSCGAGGDAFSFVMAYHKMTFPEAMKFLAERAGIKLIPFGGQGTEQQGPSDRQLILQANQQALSFFRAILRHPEHGRAAREHLRRRGISPAMEEAFQIGAAPDRWDGLVQTAQQKGWNLRALELAGLVTKRSSGDGCYDRFRNRLIFPICDSLGRPIAFGGRKLVEEDEPKYLNSPESVAFSKGGTLYGLHLAKKAVIDSHTAVIVEGYTDVIACHQAAARRAGGSDSQETGLQSQESPESPDHAGDSGGEQAPGALAGPAAAPSALIVPNVLATLGTALTPQHVAELRRYCDRVVLIYDGDEAGVKAADRAVEVFLTGDLDVSIAVIPDGLDPADLFELPDGPERWSGVLASAVDALSFQFERISRQLLAADTVTGRQKLAEEYLRRLSGLGLEKTGVIRRSLVVQRLAALLRLGERDVNQLLKQLAPRPGTAAAPGPARPAPSLEPGDLAAPDAADVGVSTHGTTVASGESAARLRALQTAERQLVGCLLRQPDLFHAVLADGRTLDEAIAPAELITPLWQRLYEQVYERLSAGGKLSLSALLGDLAAQGRMELSGPATQAEAEADQQSAGDGERLRSLLLGAADALLAFHRERNYRQARQNAGVGDTEPGTDRARAIRELLEHHRTHPSPARIARVGRA